MDALAEYTEDSQEELVQSVIDGLQNLNQAIELGELIVSNVQLDSIHRPPLPSPGCRL